MDARPQQQQQEEEEGEKSVFVPLRQAASSAKGRGVRGHARAGLGIEGPVRSTKLRVWIWVLFCSLFSSLPCGTSHTTQREGARSYSPGRPDQEVVDLVQVRQLELFHCPAFHRRASARPATAATVVSHRTDSANPRSREWRGGGEGGGAGKTRRVRKRATVATRPARGQPLRYVKDEEGL